MKIHKTRPICETDELYLEAKNSLETANCGECVVASSKLGLAVKTGDGLIEIVEIQFPNAKRMEAKAALNGKKLLGEAFAVNAE